MSTVDIIRNASVNHWNTEFQKRELSANNNSSVSLFLTQEKKFKNLQLSSALSGADKNSSTKQKGNNPSTKRTAPQKEDLNLEELRFFKFGNLY